ncbi:MAG: hypothetical protein ACT6R7_16815 [Brevundimonas aurantiaca]|jgi:hypothetical protein|uniref:hypothetical protein n=1 Tax=Brevundimonas aurantiaca TaxID=74316 RepID=UPI0040336B49
MARTDPFAGVNQADAPPAEAPGRKTIDLSDFGPKTAPAIDRGAADAARRAGEESGFASRARSTPTKATTPKAGRSRLSDIVGRPAVIEGEKAQVNILAPADVCLRFKDLQRQRGEAAWQTLAAALDALEANDV